MRPTDREEPRDMSLFEMRMGMTPEEWDALPESQDDGADTEGRIGRRRADAVLPAIEP